MQLVFPTCGDHRRLKIAHVAAITTFVLVCLSMAALP